eukprot:m.650761 g.650761  ORF g.650761 m.650761 type:complete len:113 (+) comp58397_c0_seq7:1160-1498(+)
MGRISALPQALPQDLPSLLNRVRRALAKLCPSFLTATPRSFAEVWADQSPIEPRVVTSLRYVASLVLRNLSRVPEGLDQLAHYEEEIMRLTMEEGSHSGVLAVCLFAISSMA